MLVTVISQIFLKVIHSFCGKVFWVYEGQTWQTWKIFGALINNLSSYLLRKFLEYLFDKSISFTSFYQYYWTNLK